MVAQSQALGRRALALQADVGHVSAARGLVQQTLDHLGRLDILVHAASPFEAAPFDQVTEEVWDRALDVTLKGAFFLAQAAAPALTQARGQIILISDVAARRPFPSFIPHSVAKGGLETLTLALARALAPAVRVNAIAPGVVLPPATWDEARITRAAARTLVGHIGTPDSITQTLFFLLGNNFVTGQIVIVDGGETS
jgi:NAD(P)-dependent dehydrogenase (short-subunit alcohol dehydrogenase family)